MVTHPKLNYLNLRNKTKQNKSKTRFNILMENEIAGLTSAKTQFGLLIKFSIVRDNYQ